MRTSAILVCLASQALARRSIPLAERDVAIVSGVLDTIQSDIQTLDSTVKKGGVDPEPLLKASNVLIKAIKDGKTKVDGSSDLTLNDAVQLTQPIQDMTKVSQDLVDNLKALRPTIEKLGYCDAVRTQTSGINAGSQDLIKTIVGKVPEDAREIANQLSASIVKVLQQAQDDFSEQNCKNSAAAEKPAGNSQSASKPAENTPAPAPASPAPAASDNSSKATHNTAAAPTAASPTTIATTAFVAPIATGTGTGMTMAPTGTNSSTVTAAAAAFTPAGVLALMLAALVL